MPSPPTHSAPAATAMTLYGQPKIGYMVEPATTVFLDKIIVSADHHFGDMVVEAATAASEIGARRFGETAAQSAMFADKLDLHTRAVERMHMALEVILEAQDAWVALTIAAAAQEDPVHRLLLDVPSFPDVPQASLAETRPLPTGWFRRSLDRLARKHRPFLEALFNGPWV